MMEKIEPLTLGKLEKMLILAFENSKDVETGGPDSAKHRLQVLINPDSYTHDYKLKFSPLGQGQGTSGKQLKYEYSPPAEMTFEFLFDNTGIIDGMPRANIAAEIKTFKDVLMAYQGDGHEPLHFKLVWGKHSIFKGRVMDLSFNYKMFSPDGTPIRAVAKVRFQASIEDEIRAAKDRKSSPDLTHVRRVKEGDTLPLMCHRIYGDSKYYINVAAVNAIDNFRSLVPGTTIAFPPVEKKTTKK